MIVWLVFLILLIGSLPVTLPYIASMIIFLLRLYEAAAYAIIGPKRDDKWLKWTHLPPKE
jgi:hypothetical protein